MEENQFSDFFPILYTQHNIHSKTVYMRQYVSCSPSCICIPKYIRVYRFYTFCRTLEISKVSSSANNF